MTQTRHALRQPQRFGAIIRMRPLWLDLLEAFVPLAVAAALFIVGARLYRVTAAIRNGALLLAIGLIGGLVTLAQLAPALGAPVVDRLGGLTIILCLLTVFLLGAAWGAPSRRVTSPFLGAVVLIAAVVVAIHASGRLYWRTLGFGAWERLPGNDGALTQSNGFSCGPAAASMLLAAHGIDVSEGELAYRARTSLFGTDVEGLARAIRERVPANRPVRVVRNIGALSLESGTPFVAYVGGRFAGHAILLHPLMDGTFTVLDPSGGKAEIMDRGRFERNWDRIAIVIDPAPD